MSNHAREAMFENMELQLSELITDYMTSEGFLIDQAIACVDDGYSMEEGGLPDRMAKAAMEEYKKTVVKI